MQGPRQSRPAAAGSRVDGERVGLVRAGAGHLRMHVELVERTVFDTGNEALPYPGLLARIQTVRGLVPAVEIADHADRVCIGRPDGKERPFRVVRGVRAQLVVEVAVRAFVEQVEVE